MNYNLETETFLLPYPDDEAASAAVRRDLKSGTISINAYDTDSFNREFWKIRDEYKIKLSKAYWPAKQEFQEKLNEKYGGFNKRMEAKHGLDRFPIKLREVIHSRAWEEGHSSGESEVDNCYYDIVRFVDNVLNSNKE